MVVCNLVETTPKKKIQPDTDIINFNIHVKQTWSFFFILKDQMTRFLIEADSSVHFIWNLWNGPCATLINSNEMITNNSIFSNYRINLESGNCLNMINLQNFWLHWWIFLTRTLMKKNTFINLSSQNLCQNFEVSEVMLSTSSMEFCIEPGDTPLSKVQNFLNHFFNIDILEAILSIRN